MTQFSTTHYGVTLSASVEGMYGCCGAHTIFGFTVRGNVSDLTIERKKKLYDALWLEMKGRFSGVVIATDAMLNFADWDSSKLNRSGGTASSSWETDTAAGDISLEDFCIHHEFEAVGHSINSNSGNVVAAMVKAVRKADIHEFKECEVYEVAQPDFSDEPQPEPRSNQTNPEIIAALRAAIERNAA